MGIRAVIFDFDGLIVDTESAHISAWEDLYHRHNLAVDLDKLRDVIGKVGTGIDLIAEILQTGVTSTREELRLEHRKLLLDKILLKPILPGVMDRLSEAEKLRYKKGIASNSTYSWVESHVNRLGILPLFSAIACRCDVSRYKPDPEVYLLALKKLGVEAHEALAFEDSQPGVEAAHAAGIFTIAVPSEHTRSYDFSNAQSVVSSLAEVTLAQLSAEATQFHNR
jgi:HAD superfamily hydrolase (TIGR01509 family)